MKPIQRLRRPENIRRNPRLWMFAAALFAFWTLLTISDVLAGNFGDIEWSQWLMLVVGALLVYALIPLKRDGTKGLLDS